MQDWSKIEQKIAEAIGKSFELKAQTAIVGGDTNQAFQIEGVLADSSTVSYFIKFNEKSRLEMFAAEAEGLLEIEKVQAIAVPHVICRGVLENQSYLILDMLNFTDGNASSAKQFGQQLAIMHKNTSNHFGWFRDNTIGATLQKNPQTQSWIDFWRENRLGYQLKLAKQNGANQSLTLKGEKLMAELAVFFTNYNPEPSLLHGDLWSGNYAYLKNAEPVIFDPAVYYGDRETDIAMTELFGGFSADFYSSYNEEWPLDNGYRQRKPLYNIYHILNHYNLFGGGYAMQAENMMDQLISDLCQ